MLPGLLMAVTMQLWKVVDTVLTGMLDGTVAMSAITLSLPIETLIQLPGFCLGVGGSLVAGQMLAARNNKGAAQVMTFTMIVTFVIGLMFSVAAFAAIAAVLSKPQIGCMLMPVALALTIPVMQRMTAQTTSSELRIVCTMAAF